DYHCATSSGSGSTWQYIF
nr:immunoglobulin light chain junction region [Macaca mulatta]